MNIHFFFFLKKDNLNLMFLRYYRNTKQRTQNREKKLILFETSRNIATTEQEKQ